MENVPLFWDRKTQQVPSSSSEHNKYVGGRLLSNNNELSLKKTYNNEHETLFLFGYTCKLYRDDEKAQWINSGQHLISWIGDQNLLIDRYDVRGYLNDLSEFHSNKNMKNLNNLTDEEQEFENVLNRERFIDLDESQTDEVRQKSVSKDYLSREYSNVGYCYDTNANDKKVIEDINEENDFKVPLGLMILDNITLPTSMKLHYIIEKTAMFVAQHGLQMEILLKTKQAGNSNFEFLSIDSKLNPYYKHVLSELKSGRYVVDLKQQQEESDKSDSESDDNYLHPSLLSSRETKKNKVDAFKIPSFFNDEQRKRDSYSQLVKNFKDKFADEIDATNENTSIYEDDDEKEIYHKNVLDLLSKSPENLSSLIPKPPTEIEMIINKLAQHVGQNGESFESSIKELNDKKFDFLNNGHKYHAYYVKQKIHFINHYKQQRKSIDKQKLSRNDKKSSIIFSLNTKENCKFKLKNNESIQNHLSEENVYQRPSSQTTSSYSKEKRLQELRKKKALEFLKILKKEKRLSDDSPSRTYGPDLPKPTIDIELSPTIERVTSPPNSPVNIHQQESLLNNTRLDGIDPISRTPSPLAESNESKVKNSSFSRNQFTYSPPKRYREMNDHRDRSSSKHHHSSRRSQERQTYSSRRKKESHKRSKSRSRSNSQSSKVESRSRHHYHHRRSRHHHHHSNSSSGSRSLSRSPDHHRSHHRQ